MTGWTTRKPSGPGLYETRWPGRRDITIIRVVRIGRGLQCRPDGYPPCAMGDIGQEELEWRKINESV